jgi:hypothetical protein
MPSASAAPEFFPKKTGEVRSMRCTKASVAWVIYSLFAASFAAHAAPTVWFKTPANGQTISGNFYQSSACEVGGSSIDRVRFYLDSTALNTEESSPWQCNLDTRKFSNGSHTLRAVAYDSAGASRSTQISVNIKNATANTPPTVSILKPAAGATLTAPVNGSDCEASASDPGGSVSRVDFVLSNATTSASVGSKTAAPYQCAIDTAKFSDGTYTLMAVATDNLGAKSSTQRTLTIKKAAPPVSASDIITRASAAVPFANQSGYTAQVIKTYTPAPEIPESGIHGTTLPNGETMRLGKVIDPANSLRKALAFQVMGSDPTTSGGKRAELAISPNIEMNKVYWIVFSAYVYNWGTLASGDNALFGTQMHTGDNDAAVGGPSFGLYTTQNGRYFRVQARYSTSATPSASNAVSVKYAEHPIPFGRWVEFVLKFKHNTSGNGFLKVWMDGNLIANHQGSLGYNTGYKDYAKFGYYNWSESAMNGTARKVLLRSPTIVRDPTGQTYSLSQIRALLGSEQ